MKTTEKYPKVDWQYEVANDDTVLGYAEWVEHKVESDSEMRLRGGKLEFGGSKQVFKGKSIGKQWGGGAALRNGAADCSGVAGRPGSP